MPWSAVAQVADTLINQAFAEHNRKRNFYWNEKTADNADQRQRKQYQDLYSPQAMMDQYAAAGLSPSMMMSGGQPAVGGTPQGAQGDGLDGPYPSGNIINPLTIAQIENIKAQTEKTKAETINIGADTKLTFANIIKAGEETENYKYKNELLKLDATYKELQIDLAKGTNPELIKQAAAKSEQMFLESANLVHQNKQLELQNEYTQATFETKVKQATAEYNKTLSEIELNESGRKLNEQEIESLKARITIDYFNSRTNRLSANAQMKHNMDIVDQWAKENGFKETELRTEKWNVALKFFASIIGSGCNLVASLGKIK